MLWMHRRDTGWDFSQVLPIGIWENIRVEDGKLLADTKFDDSDKFSQLIKAKVEGGLIRACSIGINPTEFSNDPKHLVPGQTRASVTKSELYEASLVDIPSNKNTVRLFSTTDETDVPFIKNDMSGKNEEKQLTFSSEADLLKFLKEKFGFEPKEDNQTDSAKDEEFKLKSESSLLSWVKEKFGLQPVVKTPEKETTQATDENQVATLKSDIQNKNQEISALKSQVENLKKTPGAVDRKTTQETDTTEHASEDDTLKVYSSAKTMWDAVNKLVE